MLRFPVYLVRSRHRDSIGNVIQHAERRLVKQSDDDTIIAIVLAPPGSRIRSRRDPNGPDQLVVPLRPTFLGRIFAPHVTIPAKYLVGDAVKGVYGLSVIRESRREPRK